MSTKERIVAQRSIATERFILSTMPVLYVPLGKNDHGSSGGSFTSSDGHGHTCTVTGALWRRNGYSFAENNNRINIPQSSFLDLTTMSIIVWVQRGDIGRTQVMFGGASGGYIFYFGAGNLITLGKADVNVISGDTAVTSTTVCNHCGVTYDCVTASFYLNAVADGTPAYADPTFGSTVRAIGIQATQNSLDFNGIIGEVLVYNRVLSPLEFQQHFIQTRWRYQ